MFACGISGVPHDADLAYCAHRWQKSFALSLRCARAHLDTSGPAAQRDPPSSARTTRSVHGRLPSTLAIVTATAEAIERGVNKRARKLALRPHAIAGG